MKTKDGKEKLQPYDDALCTTLTNGYLNFLCGSAKRTVFPVGKGRYVDIEKRVEYHRDQPDAQITVYRGAESARRQRPDATDVSADPAIFDLHGPKTTEGDNGLKWTM